MIDRRRSPGYPSSIRALLLIPLAAACMPPSVRAVDEFLHAYAAGDTARVLASVTAADRPLLEKGIEEQATNPNGPIALLLPPRPLGHEILDIEAKESDERHVISTRITMKNPLPYASERLGQSLDIPKTRSAERKFLSVKEGERFFVKLDLPRVEARTRFVERFLELLSKRAFDEAAAMLEQAPPPPDEANALKKSDRLVADLEKQLQKVRAKTSTQSGSASSESAR